MPRKKVDPRAPHEIIKDMCQLLEAWGVTRVECVYDYNGRGTWASFTRLLCDYAERDEQNTSYLNGGRIPGRLYADRDITTRTTPRGETALDSLLTEFVQHKLISVEERDKFKKALYDLLPENWATEPGSFGSLNINTLSSVICLRHTQRVIREERHEPVIFN